MSPSNQTGVMMSIRSRFLAVIVIVFSVGCQLHRGEPIALQKASKTFISFDLEVSRYLPLLEAVENKRKIVLKSRGEAHITIITPPEYKKLALAMPARKIDELASVFLQTAPAFKPICLGTVRKEKNEVFYVVVQSKDFLQFRQKLSELSGLSKQEFDHELFFPHITLGFTERDLHFENGFIKEASTCPADLQFAMGLVL